MSGPSGHCMRAKSECVCYVPAAISMFDREMRCMAVSRRPLGCRIARAGTTSAPVVFLFFQARVEPHKIRRESAPFQTFQNHSGTVAASTSRNYNSEPENLSPVHVALDEKDRARDLRNLRSEDLLKFRRVMLSRVLHHEEAIFRRVSLSFLRNAIVEHTRHHHTCGLSRLSLLPKRMRVHRFRRDSANHLREAAVGLRSTCPCPRIPTSSILLRMC